MKLQLQFHLIAGLNGSRMMEKRPLDRASRSHANQAADGFSLLAPNALTFVSRARDEEKWMRQCQVGGARNQQSESRRSDGIG